MQTGTATRTRPLRANAVRMPFPMSQLALLESFKPQVHAGAERKQSLRRDPKLLGLKKFFLSNCSSAANRVEQNISKGKYEIDEVSNIFTSELHRQACDYDARTVELFSMALPKYSKKKQFPIISAACLSALINAGKEQEYALDFQSFGSPVEYACAWNQKTVRIDGNAGDHFAFYGAGSITLNGSAGDTAASNFGNPTNGNPALLTINGNAGYKFGMFSKNCIITLHGCCGNEVGYQMGTGSKIIINGSCGFGAGSWMHNGELTINGNAGPHAGDRMQGGTLTINGNALENLGESMDGGTINVNGSIKSISKEIDGGDIFQNGRQIVKDGKKVAKLRNKW